MTDIESARAQINELDAEMARLFEKRMEAAKAIAAYKKEHALSIRDIEREKDLIAKNRALISDAAVESYYVKFMENVIKLSCDYQAMLNRGMKVAYSGVEGAFGYIAAKRMYPAAELVSFPDFTDAYRAVESAEMDCAVLPLENSYAGEVGTVMDLIFSGSLYINQVYDLEVVHHLLGVNGATAGDIKKVISHPQALDQCDDYIRAHGFDTEISSNTAAAAKTVKELGDKTVAAIASDETADIFGLKILDGRINASSSNTTRFAAFSRAQNRPAPSADSDNEHFIIVFTVRNEAGALAQTLNIIGAHGYNMRNLRSRPMKDLLWSYYFYIEAEGSINTQNGRDMLRELSAVCAKLKLVGTYTLGSVKKEN